MITPQELKEIIKEYNKNHRKYLDALLEYYKNLSSLKEAIICAGDAKDHTGKRHPHQRRLKKNTLKNFKKKLIKKKDKIQNVKTFDELFKIVEECKVKGIGDLTIYDTALRIGAKLGLTPEVIYLHAGTKEGAKKLLNKKRFTSKFICKESLPTPFLDKDLTPAHLEDILCIYKDRFGGSKKNKKYLCIPQK